MTISPLVVKGDLQKDCVVGLVRIDDRYEMPSEMQIVPPDFIGVVNVFRPPDTYAVGDNIAVLRWWGDARYSLLRWKDVLRHYTRRGRIDIVHELLELYSLVLKRYDEYCKGVTDGK